MNEFKKLLDSKEEFKLNGDEKTTVRNDQIPQVDTDYRMEIRRVCRILVKAELVEPDRLNYIDEVIGIPVISTLRSNR